MNDQTKHGERVKARIIEAGLKAWPDVTARKIGAALGMTHSAILYHFGTSDALKSAIAAEAVRIECAVIVPQLIVANHPAASGIDPEKRRAFLAGC